MKKLEIFGDSILRGVMFSAEQNKYHLCDDHDYASVSGLGVTVKNNAKMGATIARGAAVLERRLPAMDADTAVLLEFGGNDCDYDWQAISDNPAGDFLPNTPEQEFTDQYGKLIEKLKSRGITVFLSTLSPIDGEKYMRWITKGRSYDNVLRWLGDIPHLERWQAYYNRLVEEIAQKFSCPLWDLRRALVQQNDRHALIGADGIHPTQAGHDIIHRNLCAFVAACG